MQVEINSPPFLISKIPLQGLRSKRKTTFPPKKKQSERVELPSVQSEQISSKIAAENTQTSYQMLVDSR